MLDGLTRPFKELPPKHFYDARGAELFDRICELPEYYPTRAERAILEARSRRTIVGAHAAPAELVELGSGTAAKTRLLLRRDADAGTLRRYVPLDVTEAMVRATRRPSSSRSSPGCASTASSATSSATSTASRRRGRRPAHRRLPGRHDRQLHARQPPALPARACAALLRPGVDHLLLGTDLVKDPAVLEAAYDDAAGVTAEFNRNVLHVVNRELDADFDVDAFEHVAFFDREREWIEMRLRAAAAHARPRRRARARRRASPPREELRTEISAKFTRERLAGDLAAAGLALVRVLTDPDGLLRAVAEHAAALSPAVGSPAMDIDGSGALVVGGASGLGEATVRHLHGAGAVVTIADVNAEQGQALADELGVAFVACDVREEDQVQAAVDAAAEADGGLRISVCCAGTGWAQQTASSKGPHPLMPFEVLIAINLVGTFNVLRLAAQRMTANEPGPDGERGVCVNTASIAAYDGQVGQIAYSASKGGDRRDDPARRPRPRRYGVRVVTIAPGLFDTPLLAALPEEARTALGRSVPYPARLGRPEEFARLAASIVENPMLNGEVIRLDGALRMAPS